MKYYCETVKRQEPTDVPTDVPKFLYEHPSQVQTTCMLQMD